VTDRLIRVDHERIRKLEKENVMSIATQESQKLNGIDRAALKNLVDTVTAKPSAGKVGFAVATNWRGGTKSETRVESYKLGGREIGRTFTINSDEPRELCGTNTHANPQEILMAALNACMTVGYVAGATVHGIELESLTIETEGELDLRGFLGLDPNVKPGYNELHYTVRIKGDGTAEQFQAIHENVMKTSPNRWNLANPIRLTADLVVE
jgi:uncharacterized OsmC-like protein